MSGIARNNAPIRRLSTQRCENCVLFVDSGASHGSGIRVRLIGIC